MNAFFRFRWGPIRVMVFAISVCLGGFVGIVTGRAVSFEERYDTGHSHSAGHRIGLMSLGDFALSMMVGVLLELRDDALVNGDGDALDLLTVPASQARLKDRRLVSWMRNSGVDVSALHTRAVSVEELSSGAGLRNLRVVTVQAGIGDKVDACSVWTVDRTWRLTNAVQCR